MIFVSNGELNDWASRAGIELVDPGVPLMSYEPGGGNGRGYDSAPIRVVVDFIARHVSSLPLKVFRRMPDGGRERVREGEVADLVGRPTGEPLAPMRFWSKLITDGLLHDRFLAVEKVSRGNRFLQRVPPSRWRVVTDGWGEVVGVDVWGDDLEPSRLLVDEHILLMDVGYATSGAQGTPREHTLRRVLDEYWESVEYRAQVNRRGPRSPFAILRDRGWPDRESRERFQRGMREFMAGGGQAGGSLLLEDGMTTAKLEGFKPIDVDDLTARDKVKLDVANAYGIPGEMMGLREGNFSSLEAFFKALYGVHLRPYITVFEQALNVALVERLEPGKQLYLEFDTDARLRGTPETQYQQLVTATGRPFMTTSEARERMNLSRLEEGDGLVTPLNVLVGGQVLPGNQNMPEGM